MPGQLLPRFGQAVWLLWALCALAPAQPFRAEPLGVAQGLSQTSVRHVLQDQTGFLWIGTQDGLNRYDGYDIRVYRRQPDQPRSLSDNDVTCLYQDREGLLWIGTHRGLSLHDPASGQWWRLPLRADSLQLFREQVKRIAEDTAGTLWIGTHRGLRYVQRPDPAPTSWHLSEANHLLGPLQPQVVALAADAAQQFWFAYHIDPDGRKGGVLGRFDPTTQASRLLLENPASQTNLPDNQTVALHHDRQGRLWVGTIEAGLFVCEQPTKLPLSFRAIPFAAAAPRPAGHRFIHEIFGDSQGNLWVGTHGGLFWLPAHQPDSLRPVPLMQGDQLPLQVIAGISEDRAGNLWVSAEEGCYQLSPTSKPFAHFFHQPDDPQSLASNDVLALLETRSGDLWVGTGDRGLTRLRPRGDGRYRYVHFSPENSPLTSPVVLSLSEDRFGQVWVNTFGGLYCLGPEETPKIRAFRAGANEPLPIGSNYLYETLEDPGGDLWACTYTSGISRIRREGRQEIRIEEIRPDPENPFSLASRRLKNAQADHEGRLWFGDQRVISLAYLEGDSLLGFRHLFYDPEDSTNLSSGDIVCFYRDRRGALWVGADGLNRVDIAPEAFAQAPGPGVSPTLPVSIRYYDESDGLPNRFVYQITEDERGYLWLTTNAGLAQFDPETETFLTYTVADGLQSNEFSANALCRGPQGHISAGGINGFNRFHPDSLRQRDYEPEVMLTSLRLFNEEVLPGRPSQHSQLQLARDISQLEALSLTYADRVFSLAFAGTDFSAPGKQRYRYRLRGLDEAWIMAGERRFATFTQLRPGRYTFEVQATNADGSWSPHIRQLQIEVAPPWWRSGWAYGLYALLLGALVWWGLRLRLGQVRREERLRARIEQAKLEERERVRARASRDFHDEAGNKITKISLYAGLVRQQASDSVPADFLDGIEENVRSLSTGMRDFIWVLDPRQDTLEALLDRIREFGQKLFEHTRIDFRFEQGNLPELPLEVNTKRHLLLIAKEALHNSLKYAHCQEVWVKATYVEEALYLEIGDDGMGFDLAALDRVNGLQNMEARAEEIGANLTLTPLPGVGTRIFLQKQIPQMGHGEKP